MSKENLSSEEALFRLLALPPSRTTDNTTAVSRLEIKYPLPTEPEKIKSKFFSVQRDFRNIKDFSAEKLMEITSHKANLLLFMYYSPKYVRFVQQEDAQQIYNFNQRSSDMFGRGLSLGALCYCIYAGVKYRFNKAQNPEPFVELLKQNFQAIVFSSLGGGVFFQQFWEASNWNVITSSIKPYAMDEPERAAAYKSVYRELMQLQESVYDKLAKGIPLDVKDLTSEQLSQKILFEPIPKAGQPQTPSIGKQTVASETLYSSLTREPVSDDLASNNPSTRSYEPSSPPSDSLSFGDFVVPSAERAVPDEKFVEKIEFK